jgi:small subunit ribosomal protein S12
LATITQKSLNCFINKKNFSKTSKLLYIYTKNKKRPQVKGIVSKVYTMSPKKPNSANRHVAKIFLTNNLKLVSRLPGKDYLCSKYNRVLVNGGRANDLPGVSYSLIRGVYDFASLFTKRKRRSVYGVRRPEGLSTYIRKKNRSISL